VCGVWSVRVRKVSALWAWAQCNLLKHAYFVQSEVTPPWYISMRMFDDEERDREEIKKRRTKKDPSSVVFLAPLVQIAFASMDPISTVGQPPTAQPASAGQTE
jgi:hypothetical protein